MIKALTILFIFITVTIYAESENKKIDNDLHYTKKIFRSKQNLLVKKDLNKQCLISSDESFNSIKDYKKYNSLDACIHSGGWR